MFRIFRGLTWLFTEAILFLVDNLPGANSCKSRFQQCMLGINSCLPHGVKLEPALKDRQLKDILEDTEEFDKLMSKETRKESLLHRFYRAERWLHQSLILLLSIAIFTWTIMV
jgi:hypothetical protein